MQYAQTRKHALCKNRVGFEKILEEKRKRLHALNAQYSQKRPNSARETEPIIKQAHG